MKRDAPRYVDSALRMAEARTTLEHRITAQPYDEAAARQAFADWQAAANRFTAQRSQSQRFSRLRRETARHCKIQEVSTI